jgi:HK97 family phage major capsid protein
LAYTNIISRSGAQALVPEVVSNAMLTGLESESAALTLFKKVGMPTNKTRLPILSALPTAYFVNGDTGLKQTTEVDWSNKFLEVEEIAAIVPISENVLEDINSGAGYSVWREVIPLVQQAIGRTLDAAVFFGTNKPSAWPTAIVTAAAEAENKWKKGTESAAKGGIVGDFSELVATLEADGYDVNGVIANTLYKGLLRQARATTGESLLNFGEVTQKEIFGINVMYPMRGLWPTSGSEHAEAVVGDFTKGIIGVRKDITVKLLTEATLVNGNGETTYNLAQQDMVALRFTFRAAFQVANTITYDQQTESKRYPFAVMTS